MIDERGLGVHLFGQLRKLSSAREFLCLPEVRRALSHGEVKHSGVLVSAVSAVSVSLVTEREVHAKNTRGRGPGGAQRCQTWVRLQQER